MIHPDTRLVTISAFGGLGVVATRPLPRGTVIWAPDPLDLTIPDRSMRELPQLLRERVQDHAYLNDDGNWILCWDHARFVNHSCEANTLLTADGLEICVRNIAEGEQITNEYAFFLDPYEAFNCACGCESCRGLISSRDAGPFLAAAKRAASAARQLMDSVPQALQTLIRNFIRDSARSPCKPDAHNTSTLHNAL